MFRTAELGHKVAKSDYNQQVPALRESLLEAQQDLRRARVPVILVFAGVDGAGKGDTVNLLTEWLDPRWIVARAYGPPSDEMAERPEYWRYWRDLPRKGLIGIFLSSWYSRPILDRVYGRTDDAVYDEALERIRAFEGELADDGALIMKFWLHLGKDAQKARFRKLERDPLTRWRVTQTDWDHWHLYDSFVAAAERAIMRTSTAQAPWRIVEGADKRFRSLTIGEAIRDGIRHRLEEIAVRDRVTEEMRANGADGGKNDGPADGTTLPKVTVLNTLDLRSTVTKADYAKQLEKYQGRLNALSREARSLGMSTILVFEGWDAAGKGGVIRRITAALDARDYQVIPIAAPTDEEAAYHYLWRFWRHLSRAGRFTLFDRSWYGRVLVERVEGFAAKAEWRRAYAEINDFEEQLVNHGIVLCKFWIHIDKDEQHRRFKEREQIAYKKWKLTDEDWRNRDKWDAYEQAVNDMVERTSTSLAPWTLVEGNNKRFARIKVLATICASLKAGLKRVTEADAPARPHRQAAAGE